MKNFFRIISLQIFRVSGLRKAYFVARLLLFVAVLGAFLDPYVQAVVPRSLLLFVLVIVSTSLLLAMVQLLIVSAYRHRQKLPAGEQDNFTLGMNSLINLSMGIILLGSIFPIYGIPFASFLTSISVFSVAISWLFKEYLTNYFDSFRLMFSTDLQIGDYIKVNTDTKGFIVDITMRATKVKTDEGDILLIPNTTLMNTEVTNYSKTKYKRITVPFMMKTKLVYDIDALEQYLTECAVTAQPEVVDRQKIFLRLKNVENGMTSCAFELAIDQYNFAIEDSLQRAILAGVISWGNRQDTTKAHCPVS